MTAYYNQEYHEPVDPDPVPQSNWKQILKETFYVHLLGMLEPVGELTGLVLPF